MVCWNKFIPPKANLFKCKVLSKALCQECKIHPKDTLHALQSCPALVEFWKIDFGSLVLASSSYSSFLDVIHLTFMNKAKIEQFATTVSTIWVRRNKLIDGGKDSVPILKINSIALDSVQEFQQLRPTHVKIPPTARSTRWWPPPAGWVKVNFDGSLFSKDCTAGPNIITRNEHGLVMAALSQQILLPTLIEIV